jgi:hypothetical protein
MQMPVLNDRRSPNNFQMQAGFQQQDHLVQEAIEVLSQGKTC